MLKDMPVYAIIIWALLIGIVVFLFIQKIINKKKYQNVDMSVDKNWYQNSLDRYPNDDTVYQYYFHYDKNFLAQGHVLEDINHQVVYEAKFLFNNVNQDDEVDFINHIINYKHHHKVGHTITRSLGFDRIAFTTDSTFDFDKQDIYLYIKNLGYEGHLRLHGLAYTVDISKQGKKVATIYSSNNGQNLYQSNGVIEPKIGGNGIYVIETDYQNLDVVFLFAMALARSEMSVSTMSDLI